jgi:hypothetical protein
MAPPIQDARRTEEVVESLSMSSRDPILRPISDLLERALAALPGPLRPQVSEAVRTYKEMLMEARAPKLMFLGRRGAGKSSLVNALCGEPVATIGSVLSETGRPFALRELARAAGKIAFPVGGELLSAGVAGAGTWGIGEAAIAYFIENRTIDEAKERFRRRKEQKESV